MDPIVRVHSFLAFVFAFALLVALSRGVVAYQAFNTATNDPSNSTVNLAVILLRDIQTCIVGDVYVNGDSCNTDYQNGSAHMRFADNGNFKGLRPSDQTVTNYAQKTCIHTTLNDDEINQIKANIGTFISKVKADSGGSLVLVPSYIYYSGETTLSKWGCGLHPYPSDIAPSIRSQITKDTDFILVVNDIYDDTQQIRFNIAGCGGTFGADFGINGAGYSNVPKTSSLWFECALNNTFFHEWAHQLDYALKHVSYVPDSYEDKFPQALCGTADKNAFAWFPSADSAASDPDFPACAGYYGQWAEYCSSISPRDCDAEWNDHLISAHFKPGTNLTGNHCRNGIWDNGESGIDTGGNGVSVCPSICGNSICESGESSSNCCVDCPSNIGGGSTAYGTWYCQNSNSKSRVVATSQYVCNNQTLAYGYVTLNTTEMQDCGTNAICSGGECVLVPTSVCGNGACESGESSSNCCLDCPLNASGAAVYYGSWYCADSATQARTASTTSYVCNGQTKSYVLLTTNTTETRSCLSGQLCSDGNCSLRVPQPPAVCGNGIVEAGETPDTCCADVGCSSGFVCSNSTNKCIKPKKEISQETVLDVLVRLEDVRIKFDLLGDKALAISKYYSSKDQAKSDSWAKAAHIFEDAKVKIDGIQNELKANKDNLDDASLDSVRQKLDAVRSSLKEAVDAILSAV